MSWSWKCFLMYELPRIGRLHRYSRAFLTVVQQTTDFSSFRMQVRLKSYFTFTNHKEKDLWPQSRDGCRSTLVKVTTDDYFKIKAHRTHQRISAGGHSTFSALLPDRSTLATPLGDSPYCRKRTTCLRRRNCSRSSCRTVASQGPRMAPRYILQKK